MKRLLSHNQMTAAKAGSTRHKVSGAALAQFQGDSDSISAGNLKSPSTDFQFVWDPETGQRFLFKGTVDP